MRRPSDLRTRLGQRGLVAAMTTTGLSLVTAGVAFLVNIAMARALGPDNRGHLALVLQAAYVVTPVVALGVDRHGAARRRSHRRSTENGAHLDHHRGLRGGGAGRRLHGRACLRGNGSHRRIAGDRARTRHGVGQPPLATSHSPSPCRAGSLRRRQRCSSATSLTSTGGTRSTSCRHPCSAAFCWHADFGKSRTVRRAKESAASRWPTWSADWGLCWPGGSNVCCCRC